ncbi:MAG: hypothetical protein ACTSQI_20035 [Candidatus Helarchaeota archaeon]
MKDYTSEKAIKEPQVEVIKIDEKEAQRLDEIACEIIRVKAEKPDITVMDLVVAVNQGVYSVKKALAYYEFIVQDYQFDINDSDELVRLDELCQRALQYSFDSGKPLNIQELVLNQNFSIVDAQKVIQYYNSQFALSWGDEAERESFDKVSRNVVKYIIEVNAKPSVAELVSRLILPLRIAKMIIPFINKVVSEELIFNFTYDKDLDAVAAQIVKKQKDQIGKELNLVELAAQLDVGIYTLKKALGYYQWVASKVSIQSIDSLATSKLQNLDNKAKKVLKACFEADQLLNITSIVSLLNLEVYEAKEILSYYEHVTKLEFDFTSMNPKETERIDAIARTIYNAVQKETVGGYEIQEIVAILGIGVMDAWKTINYLKQKIIPDLSVTAPAILAADTEIGISSSEVEVAESLTATDMTLEVQSGSVKIEDQIYDLQKMVEKVEVKREFDYVGGLVRFKVVVRNNSGININNIDVQLRMPEHMRLIRVAPAPYSKGNKAFLPNMQPKQSQSIDFYIEPLICGTIPVETLVVYQDALGKSHSIIREAKTVVTKCPPIINPGEENIARVKNLIQTVLGAKQFKSFHLRHKPQRVFELLQESIQSWAGKSVIQPVIRRSPAFRGESYYLVFSKISDPELKNREEQIVVRLEVDADRNMTFITVACEKPETACGVLTHIWQLCEKRMAEAFGVHLQAMWCPECCAPFSEIPTIGKKIVCNACGTSFKPESLIG